MAFAGCNHLFGISTSFPVRFELETLIKWLMQGQGEKKWIKTPFTA